MRLEELGLEHGFLDEALRRYDDIVSKYHVEDFLQRVVNNGSLVNNNHNNVDTSVIMIIVVSSVDFVSVIGLATIVVIKKRRFSK